MSKSSALIVVIYLRTLYNKNNSPKDVRRWRNRLYLHEFSYFSTQENTQLRSAPKKNLFKQLSLNTDLE